MAATLTIFDPNTPTTEIAATLKQDGGVIIRNLAPESLMDEVYSEIMTNARAADLESNTPLWPEGNKTLGGLPSISPQFANRMIAHSTLLDVADAVLLPMAPIGPTARAAMAGEEEPNVHSLGLLSVELNDAGNKQLVYKSGDAEKGPNCHHYTVGATVLLEKGPGGENQYLHRENAIYQPLAELVSNMPEFIMSAMWAGTEFAEDNGATRLAPGSHKWPEERIAQEEEIGQAVMPKGSVVLWLSRTLHGAGVSTREEGRVGFFHSYIADWFRQEENQYLSVPPEAAQRLSLEARQLVGYQCSPSLGWVKGRAATDLLTEGVSSPI